MWVRWTVWVMVVNPSSAYIDPLILIHTVGPLVYQINFFYKWNGIGQHPRGLVGLCQALHQASYGPHCCIPELFAGNQLVRSKLTNGSET